MNIAEEDLKISKAKIPLTLFTIALVGTSLSMWGASWDITSHLLEVPETFFTPSHMLLYSGVGISMVSAVSGLALLLARKQSRRQPFAFGLKLIIAGATLQIIAGPGDFYWHELFGIDGLLSPTHLTLALGIMIVSIGATVGFARIHSHLVEKNNIVKIILQISFGVFWFSLMWLIFFFVLPISNGDTHNLNPDPYVAIVLSFAVLPFSFSVVFWSSSRVLGRFGAASAATLTFIAMNVTSNILTSENLLMYLPWFVVPMMAAIAADRILNKKSEIRAFRAHGEKISGAIMGSVFFMLCFPMLGMTFLSPYVFNDVIAYDVLHVSSDALFQIWAMTAIPGAVAGMLGMMFASRKMGHISRSNVV